MAKTWLKLQLLALRGKNQAIFAFHELTKKETPPKGCLMYLALSWEGRLRNRGRPWPREREGPNEVGRDLVSQPSLPAITY